MTTANKPRHLTAIDLLRGIAAVMVCLYHIHSREVYALHGGPLEALWWKGRYGISVFFVISGFLVPYMMLQHRDTPAWQGRFLGRRFIRIAGPAWLMIVFKIIVLFFREHFLRNQAELFSTITTGRLLSNLTFTVPFTHHYWFLPEYWSLSVELEFYLLMALVLHLAFKNIRSFLVGAILFNACYYLNLQQLQVFYYSGLFLMGGIAVLYYTGRIGGKAFAALLAAAFIACWAQLDGYQAVLGALTALFICFGRSRSKAGNFLGRISYSMYLCHTLVAYTAEILLLRIFPPVSLANRVCAFAVVLGIILSFAWLYNRYVEQYFTALGHRLFRDPASLASAKKV